MARIIPLETNLTYTTLSECIMRVRYRKELLSHGETDGEHRARAGVLSELVRNGKLAWKLFKDRASPGPIS